MHPGRIPLASVSSVLLFPLFDWLYPVCDGLDFLFLCIPRSSHLYPSISGVDVGGAKVAFTWTIIIVINEGVKLTIYGVRREFYLHLIGFSLSDTIEIFFLLEDKPHGGSVTLTDHVYSPGVPYVLEINSSPILRFHCSLVSII